MLQNLTGVVAQLLLRNGLCQRLTVLIMVWILISTLLLQVTVAGWAMLACCLQKPRSHYTVLRFHSENASNVFRSPYAGNLRHGNQINIVMSSFSKSYVF